jgi:outer membrane murein-binding lipoprotein Lpp
LRHELGHYLRGDIWKSLLARLLALPQWFHPAAWWSVRMLDQCSERLCDELAVSNSGERIAYARALAQLAAWRLPVPVVGACAHSHPLVCRVRCLLASPNKENNVMRSALLLAVAAALFVAGAVRVELIAKDVVHTKESARAKVEELDQTLEKLGAKVQEFQTKAAALKVQVDARIAEAQQAYESGRFSNQTQERLNVLQSGAESEQLAIVAKVGAQGDEGLVLLGVAAGHSNHQAVRRKALQAALHVGVTAAPVFVYAFEYLPAADQIFLAEQLAKYLTPECIIGLGAIVEHASPQVQDAVIRLAAASDQRLLLFGVMGQGVKNNAAIVDKLLAHAARFPGDDGLAALYALAKLGTADQKIAAVQAAVPRGQEGLPVLAAAYKCQQPKVRGAVISAAKAIGGELAEWGIQMALQDPDAGLREAAQKALAAAAGGK